MVWLLELLTSCGDEDLQQEDRRRGDLAARSRALRRVAENATLSQQEFNRAFVLMQLLGYLRRNPNDAPEADYTGYDF